jgi:hypothetical protein
MHVRRPPRPQHSAAGPPPPRRLSRTTPGRSAAAPLSRTTTTTNTSTAPPAAPLSRTTPGRRRLFTEPVATQRVARRPRCVGADPVVAMGWMVSVLHLTTKNVVDLGRVFKDTARMRGAVTAVAMGLRVDKYLFTYTLASMPHALPCLLHYIRRG